MLRDMVGITRGRPLIDQLIDPLNLILPEYSIDTEYEVCAFLATCAPESDWFKTLREYGKGAGRKYGRAIGGLVYYGRGIFQVTWLKNYQLFTEYVIKNWAKIKNRAIVYGYTEAPDFVSNPELLATPYWAVEAACWYWKNNNLGIHANKGLKGFFALQGLVNRGSATKKALHYDARLNSYEIARRVFTDDFLLSPGKKVIDVEHKDLEEINDIDRSGEIETEEPIDPTGNGSQIVPAPEGVESVPPEGDPKLDPAQQSGNENIVIEKAKKEKLWDYIKRKFMALTGANLALETFQAGLLQWEALGLTGQIKFTITAIAIGASIILIGIWVFSWWREDRDKDKTTDRLTEANSTPTNFIHYASESELEDWKKWGAVIIRR